MILLAFKAYCPKLGGQSALNTEDEMYVMAEREAKKLVLVNKDNGVETYRCSNGFTFKVKVMKRK